MEKIARFYKVSRGEFEKDCAAQGITADYEAVVLPSRATCGSAGYDFYLPCALSLQSGESAVIPTGIRAKIAEGWVLAIFPKSGLGFKYRLRLDNTVGIIDSDYYNSDNEGHIMAKLTNEGAKPLELPSGKGFCQGLFLPFGITEDDECDGVRNGGFGSTDKR